MGAMARTLAAFRDTTQELHESLEYQTATSDVLKVISRSTFNLQPVLDSLLEAAAHLCHAEMGLIATRDGELYPTASTFAFSAEWDALAKDIAFKPGRDTVIGRTALTLRLATANSIQPRRPSPFPQNGMRWRRILPSNQAATLSSGELP